MLFLQKSDSLPETKHVHLPMRKTHCFWLFGCTAMICMSLQETSAAVDYLTEIKPILKSRCYACHGSLMQKAGLRLDTVSLMHKGSDNGDVLKGNPSLLMERINEANVADRMPPEGEGVTLTSSEKNRIAEWIAGGAISPIDEKPEPSPKDHWAFRPIVKPAIPKVNQTNWVQNPIDSFILHQLESKGLTPAPKADALALLRRLNIDLIGLPPSINEIQSVFSQHNPNWYATTSARLLKDPRHGERWARHWMDIWRYSDWWGLGAELRNSQKQIWHWRDWIVESLNRDKPYDSMVRLMLAADEIDPEDLGSLRASGYLARNYFLFNRNQWLDETVEHVSKAFLGLTINCAKCHDHKFDPIKQTDYYSMRAVFEPYLVRNDVVPGTLDTKQDGISRAYDAYLNEPTYRFIRGQENSPDKRVVIPPDVPAFLTGSGLIVKPIALPTPAWHPEIRPHVRLSNLKQKQMLVESAKAELFQAQNAWKLASDDEQQRKQLASKSSISNPDQKASSTTTEKLLARNLAEKTLRAAEEEWASVRLRAAADLSSARSASEESSQELVKISVWAERQASVSRADAELARCELELFRGDKPQKPELQKKFESAKSLAEQAKAKLAEPPGKHTSLVGAEHVPTKFKSSTAFDPIPTFPSQSSGRRTALAEWITSPNHPLTARVAVNHIWARHMGKPLVPSLFDFGRKGQLPSHPKLLDWLAAEFVENGWSMKHIHRLIVESSAYQMQSSLLNASEKNLEIDADNKNFWRREPIRIESQVVRDSILKLSETLDPTMGGPPIESSLQTNSNRRSLYFFHSNNDRNLFLTTFDEAMVKDCYQREQSIVPQQALALSNSRLVHDSAPRIAQEIANKMAPETNEAKFVNLAFIYTLGIVPSRDETLASIKAMESWKKLVDKKPDSEKIARTNLIWALLNHNDFVTLR